jgi:hypothetical protein
MPGPASFPAAQRRARLAARHHLAPGHAAPSPEAVARSLVAVHGSDPSSAVLGLTARTAAATVADVEDALYRDKTLIRLLGMRRTVFITGRDMAPVIQAACSDAVAAREHRKLLGYITEAGLAADPAAYLATAQDAALAALAAAGEATAVDLAAADPRLGAQIVLGRGTPNEGRVSVASRVLFLLAAQGQAVRARPRGGWTSHQYRWAALADWAPGLQPWTEPDASVELARRWLAAYGPATVDDLRWWTGWTAAQTRRALTALRPAEADLDGIPGIVLPDDTDPDPGDPAGPGGPVSPAGAAGPVGPGEPWAALLPGLDSTAMGWQQRGWFLGEHAARLYDRNGNAGPTLWWDGRVVGTWAQAPDGEIICRFLEDVGAQAVAAAQAAATRLAATLGDTRLSARARARTFLEQELAR